MKTRPIVAGLVAAALSLSSIASFAHGADGRWQRGHEWREHHERGRVMQPRVVYQQPAYVVQQPNYVYQQPGSAYQQPYYGSVDADSSDVVFGMIAGVILSQALSHR